MRIVSWNVNGFRACLKKGFEEFFKFIDADVFCLQETKLQPSQAEFFPQGYSGVFNSAVKKGYSGTAMYFKKEPVNIVFGLNGQDDPEGRVITAEYSDKYIVTCYSPNVQRELTRLDFRMDFEKELKDHLCSLKEKKPVILCGDLNVAHEEIDIKNAKANRGNAGFTDEERSKLSELLSAGFLDSYRLLYPDDSEAYTWWSYRFNARQRNIGWRIDYFITSEDLRERIKGAYIFSEILGSDHCPIGIEL